MCHIVQDIHELYYLYYMYINTKHVMFSPSIQTIY
jgi:hypothetical protein